MYSCFRVWVSGGVGLNAVTVVLIVLLLLDYLRVGVFLCCGLLVLCLLAVVGLVLFGGLLFRVPLFTLLLV